VPYSSRLNATCGRVCLQSFDVKGMIIRFIAMILVELSTIIV